MRVSKINTFEDSPAWLEEDPNMERLENIDILKSIDQVH